MNKERREKGIRWVLNTLLPMGAKRAQIRIFGTILHAESMLAKLCKDPEWVSKIWSACDAEVSEKSILWPEMFPREDLLSLKRKFVSQMNLVGFNMEYRNIARDETSGLFRREDFRGMTSEDESKRMTYYVGVDYAISKETQRDYTAMVVAGMDEEGFLYIVDVVRGQWDDGNVIIDKMFDIEKAYRPDEWFVEAGAIQKSLGAALELRMRAEDDNKGLYLNLVLMSHGGKDKVARSSNIRARIRGKGVRFHRDASWFPDFEDECLQFDRGKNDDQVDALAYIGMGLARMITPTTVEEEEDYNWRKETRETLQMGRSAVTGY